jgi:UDP-N-acetylglucosamine 2-epimerase (non-hydrolysing)
VVTLHRPSNVDLARHLEPIVETLVELSARLPVVFPVHPRTANALVRFGLKRMLDNAPGLFTTSPLGYLEMLGLMAQARMVLTDSGGIQEETTVLGVPCMTLRENTERPITVEQGTNTITGLAPDKILDAASVVLTSGSKVGRVPELWDGKAAVRIRDVLVEWLRQRDGWRE